MSTKRGKPEPAGRTPARYGMLLGVICVSGLGCGLGAKQGPSRGGTRPAPPDGIELEAVTAWHHVGSTLEASVTAGELRFPEGLAKAELRDATVQVYDAGLTFRADRARIDLDTLESRGEGAVRLGGAGFVATGDRFHLRARARELTLETKVHVESPGS